MATLRKFVVDATLEQVKIVYLNRTVATWWNKRREKGEVAALCGWFWVRGTTEAGPFKTRSAAIRDAYYQCVLEYAPPALGHQALAGVRAPRRAAKPAPAPAPAPALAA